MKHQIKTRPILFSGDMVRAILDGRKTQTRRPVKPVPPEWIDRWGWKCYTPKTHIGAWGYWSGDEEMEAGFAEKEYKLPYGQPGDRLWVRETFQLPEIFDDLSPRVIGDMALDAGYDIPWCPTRYVTDLSVSEPIDEHSTFGAKWGRFRSPIHMPRWASRLTLEITSVRVERLQSISDADVQAEGFDSRDALMWAWEKMYCLKPGLRSIDDPWVWVVEFKRVGES